MSPLNIGEKIRTLRLSNSLTQEELAGRADLTKGYISQLENDATSPSISTLKDILDVFGVSISDFFSEAEEPRAVFGQRERVIAGEEPGFRVELLIPGAQNRLMDPALVELRPGESMPEQPVHEGEEFGYVLAGRIDIVLEGQSHSVRRDECFYFAANRPHQIRNPGKTPARILWVVSPPTFFF